jgi:membrane-associated phospholipid phosphatase
VGILTVTGSSFIAVTVVRRIINAPRPYELIPVFDRYPKSKKGKSFPSRHVFSIFLISAVIAFDCLWAGIVLGFLGIILACCRVLTGIHFVRDAVAGAISGVLCGCVGMFIFMLLI